ncbi:unnamed protein product [Rotaria sp. Silwood2]|nr:unnamed protein product [Rotaria sp. Silwood2]CAF3144055.1 unnamed protein product [Rotaria sp. Silwood2]CAF4512372.1 unnamed protein product [Rotaria sp. Silwood2]
MNSDKKLSLENVFAKQINPQIANVNFSLRKQKIQNYNPFIIQFQSKSTSTQIEIIQKITYEWKKLNNETQKIKITGRQGHDGFLVFAIDHPSFNNLIIEQSPQTIGNIRINVKQTPILPSEHSLIIHRVFKEWDITDIQNNLKEKYPYFRKATRIMGKNGILTQMIRTDFSTSKSVQQLLNEECVSIGQSIHQVRSYFASV